MLLRLRGEAQFDTQRGKVIYKAISKFVRLKDSISKRPPTILVSINIKSVDHISPATEAQKLLMNITSLQNEGSMLMKSAECGAIEHAKLLLFLRDATKMDSEVQQWRDDCPIDWQAHYCSHIGHTTLSDPQARPYYPRSISYFQDRFIAGTWCIVEAARICLLQTMIECTDVLDLPVIQDAAPFSRSRLDQGILDSVDTITSNLPYLLREIDSNGNLCLPRNSKPFNLLGILWPLHVFVTVETIDDSSFDWILRQLRRLASIIGCQQTIGLRHHEPAL